MRSCYKNTEEKIEHVMYSLCIFFEWSLNSAVQNLTRWTAEYETQGIRHPSVVVGILVAVDDERAQLSRKLTDKM